ncbi:Ferredoxin subunit of nitrite reductase or a ring-hydroxylating dioxygenase [Paenibacillus sp. UNCCL117]|uniref:Rieske (2Fe-2S) protein n=1 Tax=unclassified Paenibacillus TaxID=185978 RepID=UPI000882C8FF|nr:MULTISPECIES: Rieske 2Fe-2S domain-containing protein [unclassified Paenibacillus]SDE19267.1 Ferredoxin subunit of nitrite reductase or a ring-hydroxylating dioxygenase [Paenibacillus sp. cl123]SFW62046.1 Ferredoxin subunit of nitrite reductase or a ring-hydroxylating dioxygenase [Paenibacillus sp. UNCCL117]
MAKVKERYTVAAASELEEQGRKIVEVNGIELGVFYVNGVYKAWRNICPHGAAPVCVGRVCGTRLPSMVYEYKYGRDQEILRCPWHGWEFDLLTGVHLADETVKLRGYEVEVEDGQVYVRV